MIARHVEPMVAFVDMAPLYVKRLEHVTRLKAIRADDAKSHLGNRVPIRDRHNIKRREPVTYLGSSIVLLQPCW